MQYMVTFTISIPPMLPYMAYTDPMAMSNTASNGFRHGKLGSPRSCHETERKSSMASCQLPSLPVGNI